MRTATISIIVPVYQARQHLDQCIRSLAGQTFSDWELILVDDGSTDGSLDLCRQWAEKDPRIRLIRQENSGVSAARNTGIEAARGQWIGFVDADDWVEPDYLQKLYEHCGEAQISLCDVDDGEPRALRSELVAADVMRIVPSRYAQLPYINYVYNKLVARELLFSGGPRFDAHRRRGEDAAFAVACLLRCQTVAVHPEKLYHYRATPYSATHRFYTGVCRDELILFREQNAFFDPSRMTRAEKLAFDRWKYGKVISVLRYIARYAPAPSIRSVYIKDFLSDPEIRQSFVRLPEGISGRSLLYAFLAKRDLYSLLGAAIRLLG